MVFSATFTGKCVKLNINPVKSLLSIKENISHTQMDKISPQSVKLKL